MNTYCYLVACIGLFSFYSHTSNDSFAGSSGGLKTFLTIGTGIGFVSYFIHLVAMFFIVGWWQPIVVFGGCSAISAFTGGIAKNTFVGILASILIILVNYIAIILML